MRSALAALLLLAALPAAAEPSAEPPPPWVDLEPGRMALELAAAAPTHFVASVLVLGAVCSGEIFGDARCGETIEAGAGTKVAAGFLLATLPPLASGAVVYAIAGGSDRRDPSFWWITGAGAVGQAAGFGLALATGSPAVGVLSLTAIPAAAEVAAGRLTAEPLPVAPPAPVVPVAAPEPGPRPAAVVPLWAGSF